MQVKLVADVLKANDMLAARNREVLARAGIVAINLIGSPGCGKTTIIERTLEGLPAGLRAGVIEGDIETRRDADRIARSGVPVVQINTRGACHLDASMVSAALESLPLEVLDLIIIENVGNLVCPAGFSLGEHAKVTVLSTAEGADKPAKYPLVFSKSLALLVNKTDLIPYTDFDVEAVDAEARSLNPAIEIFHVSARTGQGIEAWCAWLAGLVEGSRGQ